MLIKPDGMKNIGYILEIFYKNNLKIDEFKIMRLDDEILAEHYAHVADKPFYPDMRDFMKSSSIAAMILVGDNAVDKVREIIGCTDPALASKGTVRYLYGTDKTKNAVHASDSAENALVEIERFFKRR